MFGDQDPQKKPLDQGFVVNLNMYDQPPDFEYTYSQLLKCSEQRIELY